MPNALMTDDYNTRRDDGSDEMPFDIEQQHQSLSRPSPITSESRIDSTGLPVPPPPPPATNPSTTKQSLFLRAVKPQTTAKNRDRTPPRAKLSSTTFPNTPETAILYMQDEDDEEEIVFSDQSVKEDTEDDRSSSISDSDTVVFENSSSNRKRQWSLATKSAMISVVLMVLLLIVILMAVFFFLFERGNLTANGGQTTADSTADIADWPTVQPSNSPTRGSALDLTLTPTQMATINDDPTPSPSSFTWTGRPTQAPTLGTPAPTFQPTVATPDPTPSPTIVGATQSPTNTFRSLVVDFLFNDNDSSSGVVGVDRTNPAVQKAVTWLVEEATTAQSMVVPLDQKYRQRFGILILYFSAGPNHGQAGLPNLEMRNKDECTWIGMQCDESGMVTNIKMPNLQLDGTIPSNWEFFPNLKSIDISKNKLQGSIPEGLYDVLGLEEIHLYKNQLTGTISSKIGNLWSLGKFHVSHNRLSGSIPPELGSTPNRIRRIHYFNVHRNQMTGSIPSNMRLRQLYYLDLGRNQFSGTLPPDFGTESVRLRHLFLDHNKFEGNFPSEVLNAGDGRLRTLVLNDNEFTGVFPGNHRYNNTIVELAIQNNNFASMERDTCKLDVWSGGELVEFKSDCLVCRCGFGLMCRHCEL